MSVSVDLLEVLLVIVFALLVDCLSSELNGLLKWEAAVNDIRRDFDFKGLGCHNMQHYSNHYKDKLHQVDINQIPDCKIQSCFFLWEIQ